MIERPGRLADANQRQIHRRKQQGVMRECLGEAFTGQHAAANLSDHGAQAPDVDVDGQQIKGIVDAGAGLEQQRQVAGKYRNILGTWPRKQRCAGIGMGGVARLHDGLDRQQTEIFDALGNFRHGRRGYGSADQFAAPRQGAILKTWHVSLRPGPPGEFPQAM